MADIKTSMVRMEQLTMLVPNEWGRYTILGWAMFKGMPRATVYINGADKTVKGRPNTIVATFNFNSFNLLIGSMHKIIDAEPSTKFTIECYNVVWENGQRTDKVDIQSKITVGKNKDGIIYLGFRDADDKKPPVLVKMMAANKWHKIFINGQDVSGTGEASAIFMKSYVSQIESIFNTVGVGYVEYDTLDQPLASPPESTSSSSEDEFQTFMAD